MHSHLSEESLWAQGLAARLRLLQATFADDPAGTRQDYISEEITRALEGVNPARKKAYLSALGELFPGLAGSGRQQRHATTRNLGQS